MEIPKPASKREQNKARKKAQIVEAAKSLIVKKRHTDFTMPELAAEANVALVTPYTYFKSKAGVLSEVLDPDHALESASAWLSDAEHEDGFEKVMAFAQSRCDRYIRDEALYRPVLFTLLKLDPEASAETRQVDDWLRLWGEGLSLASQQGLIDQSVNTALAAHTIRSAFVAILERWARQMISNQRLIVETRMTIALLLTGLSKKPADRKKWNSRFTASQEELLRATRENHDDYIDR